MTFMSFGLPGFSESLEDDAGFVGTSFLVTCHFFPSQTSSSSYSASVDSAKLHILYKDSY